MRVLVTGGLGFIGSHLVRQLVREGHDVINVDALTYAGNLANVQDVSGSPRYHWEHVSIEDEPGIDEVFGRWGTIDAVMHLAAESHVDRSIQGGLPFVQTNVVGTQVLLEAARTHGVGRFVHVSTDEVYGSLGPVGVFTEQSPLQPNSPYSASKASSDLMALSAFHTYGQDVVVTRCSNNFGPFQFPEKLIPLFVTNGIEGKPWPLYGDGANVRDWIYVADHAQALLAVLNRGRKGEVYNIGARNERSNREVADQLLELMHLPQETIHPVPDRLGHDRRYAIDPSKVEQELGWRPRYPYDDALKHTVEWYQSHPEWWQAIKSGAYRQYYEEQYRSLSRTPTTTQDQP